jgi:hypothetical protein
LLRDDERVGGSQVRGDVFSGAEVQESNGLAVGQPVASERIRPGRKASKSTKRREGTVLPFVAQGDRDPASAGEREPIVAGGTRRLRGGAGVGETRGDTARAVRFSTSVENDKGAGGPREGFAIRTKGKL